MLISRDNPRRHLINDLVRERLRDRGELGHSILIDSKDWAMGDQVIARRNDKKLEVHNGLRGVVVAVDEAAGLTIQVENGTLRTLPTDYLAEHVQYAYALTGHGMQGGTVEWAGVIGNSWDFSRNWSYTALSRSRERTRIYLAGGLSPTEVDQEEIGPKIERTEDPVDKMARRMKVRDDEHLALEQLDAAAREWYGRDQDPALSLEDREHALAPEVDIELPAPEPAEPYISAVREQLQQLRDEAREINARLGAPELADAHVYGEASDELTGIEAASARDPQPRGLRGRGDWQERDRVRQQRAQALRERRSDIRQRLGDPEAVLEEERVLLARRRDLMARSTMLRAEVIAYELDGRPVCLEEVLGPEPTDRRQRERWERAAEKIVAHRIDQHTTDPAELGIYADDTRLINEINSARVDLGLQPFGHDRGQDLGL